MKSYLAGTTRFGVRARWRAHPQPLPGDCVGMTTSTAPEAASTFTIDVRLPNGAFAEEHGVSAADVERARINAERLGIEILSVTEETPVDVSSLRVFDVNL